YVFPPDLARDRALPGTARHHDAGAGPSRIGRDHSEQSAVSRMAQRRVGVLRPHPRDHRDRPAHAPARILQHPSALHRAVAFCAAHRRPDAVARVVSFGAIPGRLRLRPGHRRLAAELARRGAVVLQSVVLAGSACPRVCGGRALPFQRAVQPDRGTPGDIRMVAGNRRCITRPEPALAGHDAGAGAEAPVPVRQDLFVPGPDHQSACDRRRVPRSVQVYRAPARADYVIDVCLRAQLVSCLLCRLAFVIDRASRARDTTRKFPPGLRNGTLWRLLNGVHGMVCRVEKPHTWLGVAASFLICASAAAQEQVSPQQRFQVATLSRAASELSSDCSVKKAYGPRAPLYSVRRALREQRPVKVLAIGSSSTVGVGASSPAAAYPARLEVTLEGFLPGVDIRMMNRGVSGETGRGAVERLKLEVAETMPDL